PGPGGGRRDPGRAADGRRGMSATYRTLVRAKLQQVSSLTVGGSPARPGGPDIQCARDGLGRLTIPGTALAGCLIDTAARIYPDLFRGGGPWGRITGKRLTGPDPQLLQSLWRFRPAHLDGG